MAFAGVSGVIWFPGSIPSLIICMEETQDNLIKAWSSLALVIYLFWLYCTMGNIREKLSGDNLLRRQR